MDLDLRQKRLLLAVAIAVPAVAFVELGATICSQFRAGLSSIPTQQMRTSVSAMVRPGDVVVASPDDRSVALLSQIGDSLPPGALTFVDPSRAGRAIEVSLSGSSRQLVGWERGEQRQVGPVRVRVMTNPNPVPVRYDFVATARAGDSQVTQGPAGSGGVSCQYVSATEVDLPPGSPIAWAPKARFTCGADPRAFVAPVVMKDRRGVARRCIWSHPMTNAIRMSWPHVSGGTSLRVGAIVAPEAGASSMVRIRFLANGASIGERQLSDSSTFESFDVPAPMLQQGGEVTIEVQQLRQDASPICVEASIR